MFTKCDKCGEEYESEGAWPFCKGGHARVSGGIKGDEIPGGVWLENYGPEPIKVYSHTERKKLMKVDPKTGRSRVDQLGREYQLTEFVRHTPVPGTDRSPHTSDWSKGSIDPQTLANARALVERVTGDTTLVDEVLEQREFAENYNEPGFKAPGFTEYRDHGTNRDAITIQDIARRTNVRR